MFIASRSQSTRAPSGATCVHAAPPELGYLKTSVAINIPLLRSGNSSSCAVAIKVNSLRPLAALKPDALLYASDREIVVVVVRVEPAAERALLRDLVLLRGVPEAFRPGVVVNQARGGVGEPFAFAQVCG